MAEASPSTHKLPPQNIEAEQSVLGGILLENTAIHKVMEILKPDDFYRGSHQKIFDTMIDLFEKDEPADLITLTNDLRKKEQLDVIGGAAYIASLMDSVPTAANIEYYARIVKEKAILRKLIETSTEIITQSFGDREDVEELLDEAEQMGVRPHFHVTQFGLLILVQTRNLLRPGQSRAADSSVPS